MSDIRIPEAVAIDTARLINEIEDRRDEAAKDLKQVWGNLRDHLKDIGLSGREISEQVGFLKGAIAETCKSDEDKIRSDKKADGVDGYVALLTSGLARARARAHEDQPHSMSMYLRKEDMPKFTGEVHDDQPETEEPSGKASVSVSPSADHVSPPARNRDEGSGSANTGGEDVTDGELLIVHEIAPNEEQTSLATREGDEAVAPNPHSSGGPSLPRQADTAEEATPPASSATPSAMTARTKGDIMRLLRPFCQHPDDTDQCGGQGSRHCTSCERLKIEAEAAA